MPGLDTMVTHCKRRRQRNHDETVQMLLDNGADVNAKGGYFGNALLAASTQGHDRVVELLLRKGACVTAQTGEYGNAI